MVFLSHICSLPVNNTSPGAHVKIMTDTINTQSWVNLQSFWVQVWIGCFSLSLSKTNKISHWQVLAPSLPHSQGIHISSVVRPGNLLLGILTGLSHVICLWVGDNPRALEYSRNPVFLITREHKIFFTFPVISLTDHQRKVKSWDQVVECLSIYSYSIRHL